MPQGAWYARALLALGAASALVPSLVMWGFTVDDALIPLRYAQHLHRFNPSGPATDGVTPLPWAALVAPFVQGDLVVALLRVKVVGVVAWTLAGALLGHALAKRGSTLFAVLALAVVALAFPIGAWAASGMETGVATALATLAAVSFERPFRAAILAGLAATLRPELVVWSVIVAAGASWDKRPAVKAAIAFAPFAVCTLVRLAVFGRAGPLALLAKPSDLTHGLVYVAAASLVLLTPALALSLAVFRAPLRAKALALAGLAHVIVVAALGGDWMPYARLLVPIAPSLALVFVDVASIAHRAATIARAVVVFAFGAWVAYRAAPAGRHVFEDRAELVDRARPRLSSSRVVAALDIGWVGAAATNAEIFDLAGLTEPSVAVLSGGHTSKAVDVGMLLDRNVDTVVVYASQPRLVELRLLRSPLFAERFERSVETMMFGRERLRYDIYRRR